jgi:hypothetical protein
MQSIDVTQPLFEPKTLNIELIFQKIYVAMQWLFNFITDPNLWKVLGTISMILSILFLIIIIFSLVRIREIQLDEKREMDNEIKEALKKEQEKNRDENPRWHYVLTLTESPNESDWRVAIMEADSMLEELLKEKGVPGNTVAELLEGARSNGYAHIQDAWDAHLIRNQIAHQGSEFPLSQVEARRIMKLFQNFFEELGII